MASLKVRVNELAAGEWDRFVYATPQGTIFATHDWVTINAHGAKAYFLALSRQNDVVAGISVIAREGRVAPPPLSQYNSLMLRNVYRAAHDNDALSLEVQEAAAGWLEHEFDAVRLVHHPTVNDIRVFQWHGWRERVKSTYMVDLSAIHDDLALFRPSLRRQLHKKAKWGFRFIEGGEFSLLCTLLEQSFNRHNARLFLDREVFEELFNYCIGRQRGVVFTLQDEGRGVAALFLVLDTTGVAYYFVAGADNDYLVKGAPSILLNDALAGLGRRAFHSLDFGGAHHPSIARFKAGFNPRLVTYFEVNYERQKNA